MEGVFTTKGAKDTKFRTCRMGPGDWNICAAQRRALTVDLDVGQGPAEYAEPLVSLVVK